MATYYTSDTDITDRLPTLTGSQIATAAERNTKLRLPARDWIDSVFPGIAPFPHVGTNDPSGYLVNGAVSSGSTTVAIDGGTNAPEAGEFFQVEGHNAWYKVDSFSTPTVTFRFVDNFNPGDETTTATGNLADFKDDTPIRFGTPRLLREACTYYAVNIAYQIMRNNPLDDAAHAAKMTAMELLQVGRDGIARAIPLTHYPDARDDYGRRLSPAYVSLVRS